MARSGRPVTMRAVIVMGIIGIALIIGGVVTYAGRNDAPTCDGQTMQQGDLCVTVKDDGSRVTSTYDDVKSEQSRTGLLLAGLGVVFVGGAGWYVLQGRRRGREEAAAGAAIREVLAKRDQTRFVSVGYGAAVDYLEEFGPKRAIGLPSGKIEVYPASMTLFDIAIAPSSESNLFKGKSDLRWLEAAAMSLPCIADPDVYPEIEHGVTGFHASTPAEMGEILRELIADPELRARVGRQAHEYVGEHRTAQVASRSWASVLREVAGAELEVAA